MAKPLSATHNTRHQRRSANNARPLPRALELTTHDQEPLAQLPQASLPQSFQYSAPRHFQYSVPDPECSPAAKFQYSAPTDFQYPAPQVAALVIGGILR